MNHLDGRTMTRRHRENRDVVIIGSGPAGSVVAAALARAGLDCIVVEAGPWRRPGEFPADAWTSMSRDYRDLGASIVRGAAPIPYLQAKLVGGASPVNGAICWRLPEDVHARWEPAVRDALPWDEVTRATDAVESRLGVKPTDPAVRGRKAALMAAGAETLGLEHRPIRRNVAGCEGLGRCLQGCPKGRKCSVDEVFLRPALEAGATLLSSAEVREITAHRGRVERVRGETAAGGRFELRARHAVVLAAGAVHSPALLLASRLGGAATGHFFQCHPGVSVAGRFREPVRMWEGATQGHEVIGLRHQGLKFETLGFGPGILAGRLAGAGPALAAEVRDLAHWVDWGVGIRAEALGRVTFQGGKPCVYFSPTAGDVAKFRQGARVLGEMLFAAGAERVDINVRGFSRAIDDPRELAPLEASGPSKASAFASAVTHMFGTCRMGSDPARSVVGPDFQHHRVRGLFVADASVFPTSTGVNPQVPIMTLAAFAAARVAETEGALFP